MVGYLKKLFPFFNKKLSEQRIFDDIRKVFLNDGKLMYAGNLLKFAYENFPNRTALIFEDKKINYKEFYFRSLLLSQKLRQLGVKPKDAIILYSENSPEFYISYFAIWQVGAVIVPVNIFLHEKELTYVVNNSDAKFAIVSEELKTTWNKILRSNKLENLQQTISVNEINWNLDVPYNIEKEYSDFFISELDQDELCVLLYTSGTTGVPKGVMLSSKNVMTNTMQAYARLIDTEKKDRERFLSVLPLFHVFAQNTCLWLPVMTGSSIIIVRKIDRKLILKALKKNPTLFLGFPALFGLLCLLKTAPLDSIRLFISGADAMPDKIRSAFALIYGRKICAGYGLTEASPVVAVNHDDETLPTEFVGVPLVGIEYEIRDDNGNVLPFNQIGTLWIKGGNIMMGYYKDSETTSKILKDGWLNTGDLACMNKKGYLAVNGRSKDLIIHKGFNIYPQEIENILLSHPAVQQVAVIGKDEPVTGQIPIAFVALKYEDKEIYKSLRLLCTNNLAKYKIPRKFICLSQLPMSATGKIDKKQLQNY